jgi:uncharacterized protein YigE (DUF2233 family)
MKILRSFVLALVCAAAPAMALEGPCRSDQFEGRPFVVCPVQAGADLRLFLTASDGQPFASFTRIEADLRADETLVFAMNAGMFHRDLSPVGLYIENGVQVMRLITAAGPGNFGMLPNGVFCMRDDGFAVIESRAFGTADCRHATQSGPMLVIEGALHPRFLPDATSRFRRNGVGVSADGQTAHFVITDTPVTFHEFARLFRDHLGIHQALYLDGNVSRLHAPALGRSDWGRPMGPIVGLVVTR